jgi:hypothetical protein
VNLNGSEIKEDLQSFKEKLDEGVSLEMISSFVNLPELSEFSKLAEGLLPANLLKVGEDGKVGLLSLNELQQSLSKGLGDIKGYLEGEIFGLFNAIKGDVDNAVSEAKEVYKQLSDLGGSIQKDNSTIADLALSTLNGATGLNLNTQSLGAIYKTASNSINSFTALSPKQVKELANPNFLGNIVKTTLDTAIEAAGAASLLTAEESLINDQLDSSGYIELSKSSSNKYKGEDGSIRIAVDRQVYWGKGEGASPEAAAKKANSGSQLVNDYSLAVDNSKIVIGHKVTFSDDSKEREGVDVATASKGLSIGAIYPVVAIYFDDKEKALEYSNSHPRYTTAIIKNPSSTGNKEEKNKIKNKISENKAKIDKLQSGEEVTKKLKELQSGLID